MNEFQVGFLTIDPTVWRFSLDYPCPRLCRRDEKLLLLSREVQVWTRQNIAHDLQSSLFSMRDIFTIFTVQIRIQWISRKSHLKQNVEIKFSKNLWKSVSMTENSPKQIENGKLYIDAKRWKIIIWDKNLKLSMYQFSSSGQYVGFSFRIFHFISSRLY